MGEVYLKYIVLIIVFPQRQEGVWGPARPSVLYIFLSLSWPYVSEKIESNSVAVSPWHVMSPHM